MILPVGGMMRNGICSRPLTKARAAAELIRMDLVIGAGIFAVAGEILALGGLPPLDLAVPGFLTMFFVSGVMKSGERFRIL
jgi:hypothetical protein